MKKIFILAVLAGFGSVAAFADGCTGTGASGDVLNVAVNLAITNGTAVAGTSTGSCTIGGYTFSNFDIYGNSGWASGAEIDLTVTVDNGGVEGAIAIGYSNPVGTMTVGDFILTYTVTPGLTGIGLNTGTAGAVSENVCSVLGGTYGSFSGCAAGDSLTPDGPITSTGNYVIAPSSTGHDIVTKDINGGSEVYQQVIPEPMTMSLMGLGLLGLGFFGRRIRK
ncbi:MAG TPA: PEP-CTERM sorting domain-containing protein [Bryobacteraceae bacterium]|nr:PEP-CTERM sorting domain-containing protein [Bryobacteraceae bacterium]